MGYCKGRTGSADGWLHQGLTRKVGIEGFPGEILQGIDEVSA